MNDYLRNSKLISSHSSFEIIIKIKVPISQYEFWCDLKNNNEKNNLCLFGCPLLFSLRIIPSCIFVLPQIDMEQLLFVRESRCSRGGWRKVGRQLKRVRLSLFFIFVNASSFSLVRSNLCIFIFLPQTRWMSFSYLFFLLVFVMSVSSASHVFLLFYSEISHRVVCTK